MIPVLLSLVGALTSYLIGRKLWWCWFVALGNQVLWAGYAIVTRQYGFLLGVALFGSIEARNAYTWTRDRHGSDGPPDTKTCDCMLTNDPASCNDVLMFTTTAPHAPLIGNAISRAHDLGDRPKPRVRRVARRGQKRRERQALATQVRRGEFAGTEV